jgi:23S rRNA maturation-related 3'-5' exoribonuclease YhaM
MGRVIPDAVQGDFHPMVGLRTIGQYVKGKVTEKGFTTAQNPFVTLALIDLDGSVSKSVAKGQYEEVNVAEGDLVQVIGSVKQLREKLPQLGIGDIVTITFTEEIKVPKGKMKKFKVEVE